MTDWDKILDHIHDLNQRYGGAWSPVWQLSWIVEEIGEVSRELQRLEQLPGKYNPDDKKQIMENLSEELGDTVYGLIALSQQLEIDLMEALEYSIAKFEQRLADRQSDD